MEREYAPDKVESRESDGLLKGELTNQESVSNDDHRIEGSSTVVNAAANPKERIAPPPNGPALSCRPPVIVPGSARRTPGESTPDPGGRRLEGRAGRAAAAGQLQRLVRRLPSWREREGDQGADKQKG